MIDVGLRAERTRADTDGPVGKGAEGTVDIRGTVQTGADRDLKRLVQDAADLGRGQRLAAETQRTDAPLRVAMPESLDAIECFQLSPKSLGKIHFVAADAIEP